MVPESLKMHVCSPAFECRLCSSNLMDIHARVLLFYCVLKLPSVRWCNGITISLGREKGASLRDMGLALTSVGGDWPWGSKSGGDPQSE